MLESHERGDQLQARFTYAAELFEPATIEQMAGHWRQLLEQLVAATPGPVGTGHWRRPRRQRYRAPLPR